MKKKDCRRDTEKKQDSMESNSTFYCSLVKDMQTLRQRQRQSKVLPHLPWKELLIGPHNSGANSHHGIALNLWHSFGQDSQVKMAHTGAYHQRQTPIKVLEAQYFKPGSLFAHKPFLLNFLIFIAYKIFGTSFQFFHLNSLPNHDSQSLLIKHHEI
jgi:hypothetical protein